MHSPAWVSGVYRLTFGLGKGCGDGSYHAFDQTQIAEPATSYKAERLFKGSFHSIFHCPNITPILSLYLSILGHCSKLKGEQKPGEESSRMHTQQSGRVGKR